MDAASTSVCGNSATPTTPLDQPFVVQFFPQRTRQNQNGGDISIQVEAQMSVQVNRVSLKYGLDITTPIKLILAD
jgi:hypothetical protein